MTLTELMNELHSAEKTYIAKKSWGNINLTERCNSFEPKSKDKGKKNVRKKKISTKKNSKLKSKCFKCGQNSYWK